MINGIILIVHKLNVFLNKNSHKSLKYQYINLYYFHLLYDL